MQQPRFIGVCLSTINEEDRFNFVKELNKYAVKNDYRLIVFNSCSDLYDESTANNTGSASVYQLLPYDRLSAVIIFPNIMYDMNCVNDVIQNCKKRNIPIISIDKELEGCITFRFRFADVFEKLCNHVIRDHHAKNIFMIAGFKDNVYSEERIAAFKKALEDNGLEFKPENVDYGGFWEQPTLGVLDKWFVQEKREIPDAIVCANDFMAVTTSSYLQQMGVMIPEQCIVTGFDGLSIAEYLPPALTTCKQDFDTMGRLLIEAIIRLNSGETVEGPVSVDFNIVYSQSCGCKKISYANVRGAVQSLISSLRLSDERQKMVCNAQDSIPKIADINYLPRMLMDKFRFYTCIFAVNDGVFDPPDFGSSFKGERSFSDNVKILYHRYAKKEFEQCTIPVNMLFPRYDLIAERSEPIIVCCANFTDMVMGYCAFQCRLDIDEYEKIHSLMATIGSALGNFHGRVQIRSMNQKLLVANDELKRLSQRDYMTGLFNRRGFFEKLESVLSEPRNQGSALVLISADLDELKYINDTFGHAEGDNAIITVGKALLGSAVQSEICARFGGDEFCVAVVINEDVESFYFDFRNRFNEFLFDYNRRSGKPYEIKASIGYHAGIIGIGLNTDDMIRAADEMMYAYKLAHKRKR